MSAVVLGLIGLLAAPAPVKVELACVVTRHDGDEATPVARPKVNTLAGRPAKIEVTTGAGDGRPAEALTVEVTPTIAGDLVTLSGAARLAVEGRAPVKAAVEDGAATVEADGESRYTVRCTPSRATP